MSKKSRGNLLTTFIILVAMSVIIFSFLSFIAIRIREATVKVSESGAFYIAEAGLNKAIWYLATPTSSGGKGLSWRVTGSTEAYGRGLFRITVSNTAVSTEVFIISTGEAGGISKTVSQVVNIGGLPPAFDFAIYSNSPLNTGGNAAIDGSIFINGNANFSGSATITDGYVYHPVGTTVSGAGTYTDGGEPNPIPTMPTLDTSYYSGLIAAAQGAAAGDITYNNTTVNLAGATVYVHGKVTISGTTTINGPGNIVATGNINMSGSTYSTNVVKFISGGTISITGNTYMSGAIFYSSSAISASGNTRVQVGGMISNGTLSLGGNINVSGIIYSTGQASISGNPTIRGALCAGDFKGYVGITGSTSIIYDPSVFPSQTPPGFPPSSLSKKQGTWKGD